VEVGRQLADAVVVQLDVGVKQVIDGPNIVRILGPPLTELVGAKVWNLGELLTKEALETNTLTC
jgi:hypothetical protein